MMTLSGGRRGAKPERATWWFGTRSARQRHSALGAGGTGRGLLSLDGWTPRTSFHAGPEVSLPSLPSSPVQPETFLLIKN